MVNITTTQGWEDAKAGSTCLVSRRTWVWSSEPMWKEAGLSVLAFSELGRQIQEIGHLLARQPTLLSELQYSERAMIAEVVVCPPWMHACDMCICTHICMYITRKHTHHTGRGLKHNRRCHHSDSLFAGMPFPYLLPEKTLKDFQCWWWEMHGKQCYKLPTDFIV